jgi:hypothetical protein
MSITRTTAIRVIAMLSDAYPSVRFGESAPATWQMVLSDYSDDQLLAVMPAVLRAHPEFCPSTAAFAKAIDDAMAPKVDVQQAWQVVHDAIKACGSHQPNGCREYVEQRLPADAPVVITAAQTIGWQRLGQTPFSEHGTLFAQFRHCLEDAVGHADSVQLRDALAPGNVTPLKAIAR